MKTMGLILVGAIAMLGQQPSARAEGSRLVIMPVKTQGVPAARATFVSDAIVTACDDLFAIPVIGPEETRALLTQAGQRAVARCQKMTCWAKVGETVNADYLLFVKVNRAGKNLKLATKWVDLGQSQLMARQQLQVKNDALDYLPAITTAFSDSKAEMPEELKSALALERPRTAPAPAPTETETPAPADESPAPADTTTRAQPASSGWLGMAHRPVDSKTAQRAQLDSAKGALVTRVVDGSPAQRAGITTGDVVLECNGVSVVSSQDLSQYLKRTKPGQRATMVLWRHGKRAQVWAQLGQRP